MSTTPGSTFSRPQRFACCFVMLMANLLLVTVTQTTKGVSVDYLTPSSVNGGEMVGITLGVSLASCVLCWMMWHLFTRVDVATKAIMWHLLPPPTQGSHDAYNRTVRMAGSDKVAPLYARGGTSVFFDAIRDMGSWLLFGLFVVAAAIICIVVMDDFNTKFARDLNWGSFLLAVAWSVVLWDIIRVAVCQLFVRPWFALRAAPTIAAYDAIYTTSSGGGKAPPVVPIKGGERSSESATRVLDVPATEGAGNGYVSPYSPRSVPRGISSLRAMRPMMPQNQESPPSGASSQSPRPSPPFASRDAAFTLEFDLPMGARPPPPPPLLSGGPIGAYSSSPPLLSVPQTGAEDIRLSAMTSIAPVPPITRRSASAKGADDDLAFYL